MKWRTAHNHKRKARWTKEDHAAAARLLARVTSRVPNPEFLPADADVTIRWERTNGECENSALKSENSEGD